MNKLFGFASIGLMAFALAASAPSNSLAQKKAGNKKADATDATPQQYALLAKYKEMVGTIRSTTATSIVLRVDYTPPGAAGTTQQPAITGRSASTRIRQAQQAQQKMLKDLQAQSKSGKEHIDFELPLTEKVSIRRMVQGVEYDDKGNAKEQKPADAKGGGGPGFAAKLEDLNTGDHVKVYLLAAAKAAPATPKKDSDGAIMDLPMENRPQVRMVVLLEEANAPANNNKKKK